MNRPLPLTLAVAMASAAACQVYPFELRLPERVTGHKVVQQVATRTPTDILFVIDNSGSMLDERTELARNVTTFINEMAQSQADFHVGIVTTDVDCNIPERACPGDLPGGQVTTAAGCCALVSKAVPPTPLCQDEDLNHDGRIDWTSCDGGRLRAPRGNTAYWTPPAAADANAWANDFATTIRTTLGCQGSGLESGLEAARRAINCSALGFDANNLAQCPSNAVAQLNQGFVRPEADLVVIFVTDEDDCSFLDPNVYQRPSDPNNPADQATHLCTRKNATLTTAPTATGMACKIGSAPTTSFTALLMREGAPCAWSIRLILWTSILM